LSIAFPDVHGIVRNPASEGKTLPSAKRQQNIANLGRTAVSLNEAATAA
jgi:hypothetical protein